MTPRLRDIRVLYREPDTLTLWGIPYEMRPGQQPSDILRADIRSQESAMQRAYGHYGSPARDSKSGWIYLGNPGWWGTRNNAMARAAKRFLRLYKDYIPEGPNEWIELPKRGR